MNGFTTAPTALAAIIRFAIAAYRIFRARTIFSASRDKKDIAGSAPPSKACNDNHGAECPITENTKTRLHLGDPGSSCSSGCWVYIAFDGTERIWCRDGWCWKDSPCS